jgi:hypothetical protein
MTFLSDAERVWLRMKDYAALMAEREQVPSLHHALSIVSRIIREEHALSTPDEAREYFAAELQRMIRDECQKRSRAG